VANRGTAPIVANVAELDQWKHCPRCAARVEPEGGEVECGECGFKAYASSKPTASAVCLDDEGRVLLSRRAIEPFKGKWDLPGGFLDEEEHPLDCLHRELREEAGVEVEPIELLGVWIDRYGGDGSAATTLNLYWTARIVEGTPEPHDDVAELRWFAPGEIADDELAFAHTQEVLAVVARQQHA
jgi:ADP-ribose pyrophosphatase YjhB (NUDIX family)